VLMSAAPDPARIFLAGCTLWAIAGFALLLVRSWRFGQDYSVPAGSGLAGAMHNLASALVPTRKESVRRHPLAFCLGLLLHAGVLSALVGVTIVLGGGAAAAYLTAVRPLLVAGVVAGVVLLFRRCFSRELRRLSVPDDYVAIVAVCGFLLTAAVFTHGHAARTLFAVYSGLLLLYMPLGKLRHAVLFFVVRAEYGWRLGRRGVYPAARSAKV
jgi:hypothetical protein